MINKKQIKMIIEDYELYHTGFSKINGACVEAKNIRVRKDKIVADVILIEQDTGDGHGSMEVCRDCEYPLSLFKEKKK